MLAYVFLGRILKTDAEKLATWKNEVIVIDHQIVHEVNIIRLRRFIFQFSTITTVY